VRELAAHLGPIAVGERDRFIEATSIDVARYRERFSFLSRRTSSLTAILELAGII